MVAKRAMKDIDAYCETAYDDGHRKHLGASLIGRDCKRFLWYVFRWCHKEKFDGRMQRLFQRGHKEESRFIEYLEGCGFKVWAEDYSNFWYHPESDAYFLEASLSDDTAIQAVQIIESDPVFKIHVGRAKLQGVKFPQFRIHGVNGHFGGSLDGIAKFPPEYGIDEPVLLEFKTNGTGAGFNKLTEKGMPIAKPEHFAQTSVYGNKYKFRFCLYLNTNKNDDSIHCELVKLNWKLGEELEYKAEQVIMTQEPPPRLSNNPTTQSCQYCSMKGICHKGEPVERNCRSCRNAKPIENKEWFCGVYSSVIPSHIIPVACPSYQSINANVS